MINVPTLLLNLSNYLGRLDRNIIANKSEQIENYIKKCPLNGKIQKAHLGSFRIDRKSSFYYKNRMAENIK